MAGASACTHARGNRGGRSSPPRARARDQQARRHQGYRSDAGRRRSAARPARRGLHVAERDRDGKTHGEGEMSDTPIHELSPQEATERLAAMQRNFDARHTTRPPEKPATAADAKARLDHLTGDKEWARKLESGDADTNREFHTLAALAADAQPADQLDRVLA